jgi:hypothetical protein
MKVDHTESKLYSRQTRVHVAVQYFTKEHKTVEPAIVWLSGENTATTTYITRHYVVYVLGS